MSDDLHEPAQATFPSSRRRKIILTTVLVLLTAMSILSVCANAHYLLGALGFLSFAYGDPATEFAGSFFICIGPLLLVTILVARAAAKAGANLLLTSGTTSLITGVVWIVLAIGSTRYAPTAGVAAIFAVGGLAALAVNFLRRPAAVGEQPSEAAIPDNGISREPSLPVQPPVPSSGLAVVGRHALSIVAGVLTLLSGYSWAASAVVFATGGVIPGYGADGGEVLGAYLMLDACLLIPTVIVVWWMYRVNRRRFPALYFGTAAFLALASAIFVIWLLV